MPVQLPSYELEAVKELDKYPNWVVWAEVWRGNAVKPTKPPFTISGGHADTTNPRTWSRLGEVCGAIVRGTTCKDPKGIGFVFSDSTPFAGIDLDNCRDPDTAEIQQWALDIIKRLDSYTEVSPSKTGLHVLVRTKRKFPGRKKGDLEVYSKGRYFTVTGWHYAQSPDCIEERTDELQKIIDEYLPAKKIAETLPGDIPDSDYEISQDAKPPKAKFDALYHNDKDFARTWDKKRTDLPSQSEFELSLMMSAVRAKWTPQEAAALVIAHRREHDPDKLSKVLRPDYIDRTYRIAMNAVADDIADADVEVVEGIKASIEAGRDETLSMLSSKLGADVSGAIRRGSEETQYYLIIGGKEARLGESKDLLNLARVRANIFDITGKTIKNYKQPVWFKMVEAIYSVAEFQEIQDSSRAHEVVAWLTAFIEASTLVEPKRWTEGLKRNQPFVRDNRIYVHLDTFRNFIRLNHDVRLTSKEIRLRLKEVGMTGERVVGPYQGKSCTRYLWSGDANVLLSDYFRTFIPENSEEFEEIDDDIDEFHADATHLH